MSVTELLVTGTMSWHFCCCCFLLVLLFLERHWATCYRHNVLPFLLLLFSFGLTLHRASLGYLLQIQLVELLLLVFFLLLSFFLLIFFGHHWATSYRHNVFVFLLLLFSFALNLPRAPVGYLLQEQLVGFVVVFFFFFFFLSSFFFFLIFLECLLTWLLFEDTVSWLFIFLFFVLFLLCFSRNPPRGSLGYLLQIQLVFSFFLFFFFFFLLIFFEHRWATCYRHNVFVFLLLLLLFSFGLNLPRALVGY